jgi:hypothetical protein
MKQVTYPYYLMAAMVGFYIFIILVALSPIIAEENKEYNPPERVIFIQEKEIDNSKPLPIIDILEEQPKIYNDKNEYIDNGEIYGGSDDDAINELKEMVENDLRDLEKRFNL